MKLTIFALALSITAIAQNKPVQQVSIETRFVEPNIKIVANLGVDFAIGNFSNSHSLAPSVGLGAYFKINNNMMWGINLDEHYFIGKEITGTDKRYNGENVLRLTTNVLVRNNNNSVILGLNAGVAHASTKGYSERSFTWGVSAGVPIVGRIPVLGRLFSAKHQKAAGVNLLLFITPRVSSNPEER